MLADCGQEELVDLSRTDALANFFKGCGYFRDIAGKTKNRAAGGYRRKNSYLDNRLFDGDVARFERRGKSLDIKEAQCGRRFIGHRG